MKYKGFILTVLLILTLQNICAVENRPVMRRACLNRADSTLELLWFRPTDNCNSFTHFNLYGRDNPLAVYKYLATYNSFAINTLTIKLPNLRNWQFYLVYSLACNGTDSIFSDTISIDNTPPINSELDSVSVDLATQKTIIGWKTNSSVDISGYIVYHVTGTNAIITNTTGTSYLDIGNRNPGAGIVRYSVAAFDSCNNTSLISSPHQTVFLQSNYDECGMRINLNWSNYVGWDVGSYQIFRRINTGNYQLVGTVVSNINQFTYNFTRFGNDLCFYIRAIKTDGTSSSSSNSVCVTTSGIIPSRNSYIAKASVQNNGIDVTLVTANGSSIEKVNVYKKEGTLSFNLWQTIPTTGGVIEIRDDNVFVQSKTYSYFFTTEGRCSLIFDTSQIAQTILLNVSMIAPGQQILNWSLYDDFIKNTEKQELLLSDDLNYNRSSPWNTLNTYNNSETNSTDNTTLDMNQQMICYCIRAIENIPNATFDRQDTSYSNIQCVTSDPIVFFPNAIQINGFNTSFYPKGVFIDYTKSTFQIYNRWGEVIYETNDIRKAWFGTFNDDYVESDVYAYRAMIVGINGKILYFDGTITVLK